MIEGHAIECATRLEKVIVSLMAGAFILARPPGVIVSSDDCASLLEKAQALLTQEGAQRDFIHSQELVAARAKDGVESAR